MVIGSPEVRDSRDIWAPIILAANGFESARDVREGHHLQRAADSLGYPQTPDWDTSLKVADSLSSGEHRAVAGIADHVGITPLDVKNRVADLRFLFGNGTVPQLVDELLHQRYLRFDITGASPRLRRDAAKILDAIVRGEMPERDGAMPLYDALGSAPTPSAAIRRAYELQVRRPVEGSRARRVGFHLLREGIPPPRTYPRTSRGDSVYRDTWDVTKSAIEGNIEPTTEPINYKPLSSGELAVASLAAVGCTNAQIGQRLALAESTVRNHLRVVGGKVGAESGRDNLTRHLFKRGIFFVTRPQRMAVANP